MIAVQVMGNDVAVGFGGAGGYLEMNVYKPLMIYNITHSITILTDGCANFRKFLVEGTRPNTKKIQEYVERSLMLVTALSPVVGYDKASKIAHYADDHDLTLREAALKLGFVSAEEFDRVVDPSKMVHPYVVEPIAHLKELETSSMPTTHPLRRAPAARSAREPRHCLHHCRAPVPQNRGLLPPVPATLEIQVSRVRTQLEIADTDLLEIPPAQRSSDAE